VYRVAGAITVHSDGNKDHILTKGVARTKVHSIPNWVDTDLIRPGERNNAFRAEAAIGEREFVVLFAGTMGWSQGLDTVIRAARLLKEDPDVMFLLVGDGAERKKLGEMAADLPRVRFMPMQPQERYSQVLAASDACLVTLRPEVATPVVPSKLLSIMAASRPVLASLPLTGDAPKIVSDSHAGVVSPAGNEAALASAVRLLKADPQRAAAFGQSGREYAIRHFSRRACVRQFEQVLRQISKTPPATAVTHSSSSQRSSYELPRTLPK
jgi:colanic acid biosynthesis glycosyl transferase WcaI